MNSDESEPDSLPRSSPGSFEIALIAVHLIAGKVEKTNDEALLRAADLLQGAKYLEDTLRSCIESEASDKQFFAKLPKFPVKLDDALKEVMSGAKDEGERLGRYKRYLQASENENLKQSRSQEPPEENAIEDAIDGIVSRQRGQGLDFGEYARIKSEVPEWWKAEVSKNRSLAGKSKKRG